MTTVAMFEVIWVDAVVVVVKGEEDKSVAAMLTNCHSMCHLAQSHEGLQADSCCGVMVCYGGIGVGSDGGGGRGGG